MPSREDRGDLKVRRAEPRDDAAVGELLVSAFLHAYAKKLPDVVYGDERKRSLRAVAEKRAVADVWVAEQDGAVVGTVALYPPGVTESEAWLPGASDLRHLATRPDLHGRGLSGALLDAAERFAKERGDAAICLHVRKQADGVARLYQRRGFVRAPEGDLSYPEVELEAYVMRLTRAT